MLDREDPTAQAALRACARAIGLVGVSGQPRPQSLSFCPLSSRTPALLPTELGCRWCVLGSGPLFLPESLGLSRGGSRAGVSEGQDGSAGREKVSTHWGSGRNQKASPLSFCSSCKVSPVRGLRPVWLLITASAVKDPSRILQAHPDPLKTGQLLQTLGGLRQPRGFFLGLALTVSEHSANSEVSCFSRGSATLGSGRKEADRGRSRTGKAAKVFPREVPSSWHWALCWGSMQPPAK